MPGIMKFDPTKKYAHWSLRRFGLVHLLTSMRQTVPEKHRDRVEWLNVKGIYGWVYRPKEAIEAT